LKFLKVPEATIRRLSRYSRCLDELVHEGEKVVSSAQLATHCGVNAAQVRKDLAYFGEFGIRGVGYYAAELKRLKKVRETVKRKFPFLTLPGEKKSWNELPWVLRAPLPVLGTISDAGQRFYVCHVGRVGNVLVPCPPMTTPQGRPEEFAVQLVEKGEFKIETSLPNLEAEWCVKATIRAIPLEAVELTKR